MFNVLGILPTIYPEASLNDPLNDPLKLTGREQKLLHFLHETPEMTRKQLAEELNCSDSTVKREIKILSEKGVISHIGSKKGGTWIIHTEILEENTRR